MIITMYPITSYPYPVRPTPYPSPGGVYQNNSVSRYQLYQYDHVSITLCIKQSMCWIRPYGPSVSKRPCIYLFMY